MHDRDQFRPVPPPGATEFVKFAKDIAVMSDLEGQITHPTVDILFKGDRVLRGTDLVVFTGDERFAKHPIPNKGLSGDPIFGLHSAMFFGFWCQHLGPGERDQIVHTHHDIPGQTKDQLDEGLRVHLVVPIPEFVEFALRDVRAFDVLQDLGAGRLHRCQNLHAATQNLSHLAKSLFLVSAASDLNMLWLGIFIVYRSNQPRLVRVFLEHTKIGIGHDQIRDPLDPFRKGVTKIKALGIVRETHNTGNTLIGRLPEIIRIFEKLDLNIIAKFLIEIRRNQAHSKRLYNGRHDLACMGQIGQAGQFILRMIYFYRKN